MAPELRLNNDEIHLWISYPDTIRSRTLTAAYKNLLNESELDQYGRFCFEKHRHQYLVTRALLRTTLSRYAGVDPAAWEFSKNRYGKPRISGPSLGYRLCFNISHTDGAILCGITAGKNLGVDIEDPTRESDTREITDRFFSRREKDALMQVPARERQDAFYDYWTLKESYIKACGMGLSIPLDAFSFQLPAWESNRICFDSPREKNPHHWKFMTLQLKGKYKAAIALRSKHVRHPKLSLIETVPLWDSQPVYSPVTRSSGEQILSSRPRC